MKKTRVDHRSEAPKKNNASLRVYVSPPVYAALSDLGKLRKIPIDLIIQQLIEFYSLKHLDVFTDQLNLKYEQEIFTPIELAQLATLYTLLNRINQHIHYL